MSGVRTLAALLGVAWLAACGGGGGGATTPAVPAGPFTLVSGPQATLTCLRDLAAAQAGEEVERTALSADGTLVAVGDAAGHLSVFDPVSGARRFTATLPPPGSRFVGTPSEGFANGYGERVTGLAFLAGDAEILAVSGYGTVVRYAAADGTPSTAVELPSAVACLAVSAAGTRLAVGTDRGAIEEYALPGLTPVRTYRPADDAGSVHALRYGPQDATLLTALADHVPAGTPGAPPAGPAPASGLTRWNTTTGQLDLAFGGPQGSAAAFQDPASGRVVVGVEDGQGRLYDGTTGVAVATGFELHAGLGPIVAGGQPHAASCGFRNLVVVRLSDQAVLARSAGGFHTSRFTPRSFSSAAATNRFAVGRQDGSAAVYEFVRLAAAGAPQVLAKDQVLGQVDGVTVRVTAELSGHTTKIVEIGVSRDGRFVLTRDATGRVLVWDRTPAPVQLKPGAPPDLRVVALPSGLGTCPARPARFSFGPGGDTALVRTESGSLLRVALPSGALTATVQVLDGATPVPVRAALDVAPGVMLVGSENGGLFVCDGAGLVQQTLSPDEPVGPDLPVPVPFATLLHWPQGPQVLVAPQQFQPGLGETKRAVFLDTATWQPTAQVNQPYIDGRFAAVANGSRLLLGERYERRGLMLLAGPPWQPVAGVGGAAPRDGFAAVGDGLLLGAHGPHLRVLREQAGEIVAGSFAHGLAGRPSAFAGSEVSGRSYVGLANGQVLELAAQ